MADLPEQIFGNPPWHALHDRHRHLAQFADPACRYRSDVAPFAAVDERTPYALRELHSLLAQGDSIWLFGSDYPEVPELSIDATLDCLQMVLPMQVEPPAPTIDLEGLTAANAPEMVALTDLAFPGFFRPRTCDMGVYYGVRSEGDLIAMAGERLMLECYSEISGVCTHPAHRGRGLAADLIWQLVRDHRRDGVVSWLHVGLANRRAIELYLRLGFEIVRQATLNSDVGALNYCTSITGACQNAAF